MGEIHVPVLLCCVIAFCMRFAVNNFMLRRVSRLNSNELASRWKDRAGRGGEAESDFGHVDYGWL
jgi:hypothetical protein